MIASDLPVFAIEDYSKVGQLIKPQIQNEHKALHPDCAFVFAQSNTISLLSMWQWIKRDSTISGMTCMRLIPEAAAIHHPGGEIIRSHQRLEDV